MKSINFITTLSANQHKKLTRWYQTSVVLFCACALSMIIITFKQYRTLTTLKKEQEKTMSATADFKTTMSKKHTLKKQEEALQQKMEKITQFSASEKNPALILSILEKTITTRAWIESVSLEKTALSVVILCKKSADAMKIMNDMQKLQDLEKVTLVSLQPKNHNEKSFLRMAMKATWKQNHS